MKNCVVCQKNYDDNSESATAIVKIAGKAYSPDDKQCCSQNCIYELYTNQLLESNKKNIVKLLDKRRVPVRFRKCTFENFICSNASQSQALTKIMNWDCGDGRILYIHGSVGTGKTHLMVALMSHILTTSPSVSVGNYYSMYDIRVKLQESFRNELQSTNKIMKQFKSNDILFIDDFGTVKDWEKEYIWQIIDYRYSNCQPFVLNSNLSIADVSYHLGPAIASRCASGDVIRIEGNDHRLQRNYEKNFGIT